MKHAVELVGPKALRRANAMTWTENVFCWPEGVVKLLRPVLGNPLGAVSHNRVYVAFKYEEILSEVYHDGLVHLAPVTAFLGKTPQEMRQILGRGLWKRLLAQSPNRINLIGECVSTVGEGNLQEHISKLIPIRSGILRRRPWVASKAQAAASILSPRVEDFNRTYHLLADLAHMKSVSGEVMNWDWSWTRMKEEHEIETARLAIVRRKQREARDASLSEEFTEATTHTVDGYTFTRLNTKGKISDEGDFMAHCVGSYGSRAYSRQYDVYKVEGPDERATLGVSLAACALKGAEGKALWASYNQCYQKRNQRVSKELEEACYKLISELNEGKEPLVSSTRYY